MKLRTIPAVLLAILMAACSSAGPTPAEGVPEDDELGHYRERLADDLLGYVQLETPVIQRAGGDQNLLKVSVPVRNISGKDLELLVQVDFLDALGVPNGDQTPRRVFMLPRGSTKWFEVVSRTSSAHDYVMHVWKAEP